MVGGRTSKKSHHLMLVVPVLRHPKKLSWHGQLQSRII